MSGWQLFRLFSRKFSKGKKCRNVSFRQNMLKYSKKKILFLPQINFINVTNDYTTTHHGNKCHEANLEENTHKRRCSSNECNIEIRISNN